MHDVYDDESFSPAVCAYTISVSLFKNKSRSVTMSGFFYKQFTTKDFIKQNLFINNLII
jgi:hypothetical protein